MNKLFKRIAILAGLIVFCAAIWVLYNQLKSYEISDIFKSIKEIPLFNLVLAALLTAANYAILTAYDYTAFRYIGRKYPYAKTAPVSFISYAFSNNIGFGMIAGSSVRFREYSIWGFSPFEITKVIVFCSTTLWLGFFMICGFVFTFGRVSFSINRHIPVYLLPVIGIILLLLVLGYILLIIFRKKPLNFLGLSVDLPGTGFLLPQFILSSLDWILASGVLYALFLNVHGVSYFTFIAYYFIAVTTGLLSQVPGGLGVFESLIVLMLSSSIPSGSILGYLIIYRIIYFFIPLTIAVILAAVRELLRLKERFGALLSAAARRGASIVPVIMSLTNFLGGSILLFSGVTPSLDWRIQILSRFIPLPVFELSHFLGSIAGLGLILLSRGIYHRLNSAYFLTIAFLGSGIIFSLVKGLDVEEAIILALMLIVFIPSKKFFYRKTSILNQNFSPKWIIAIALIIISSIWLGFFSYKNVQYSDQLWWNFEIYGNASRFLRASTGVSVLAIVFGILVLLKREPPEAGINNFSAYEKIIPIIMNSADTNANLALMGDKSILMNEKRNAFIMYGVRNRTWVAMGDPVGPESEWPELVWTFHDLCDSHDGITAFYEVSTKAIDLFLDLGLTPLKIGEQARVNLETFSISGKRHRGLRNYVNRIENEGFSFEIIGHDRIREIIPDLSRISESWLKEKNTKEKGFSLGFFREDYISRFPVGIVRNGKNIVAFANIWEGSDKEEFSIDLMRYSGKAPSGIMDYLFTRLILWGKQDGFRWFNLGMAPLSGLESDNSSSPVWNKFGTFIYRQAEYFYNFQGIRQYKEKFYPVWESRFLAVRPGISLPISLANIAALISGGIKGLITK